MKRCSKCRERKNAEMFHVDRAKASGLASVCKKCRALPVGKTKDEVSEVRRWERIFTKYRIRKEDYNAMFSKQGGCCAICQEPHKKLHIDHCHNTGMVRGLLCSGCNLGLGHFRDNPKFMYAAIAYLSRL